MTEANIDPDIAAMLRNEGYAYLRLMPDGHIAGVKKYLFTFGICTRLDWSGYADRWCYESQSDAIVALAMWDGIEDPPGPWIKHKGLAADRNNPKLFDVVGINSDGSEHCEPKASVDMADIWRLSPA